MKRIILLTTTIALLASCSKKEISYTKSSDDFYGFEKVNQKTTIEPSEKITLTSISNPTSELIETNTSNTEIVKNNSEKPILKPQNLTKKERKAFIKLVKEVKKNPTQENVEKVKTALTEKKAVDDNTLLLVIIALLLPPLAVYLLNNAIDNQFWIDVILTILGFLPGVVYALYLILS